MASDLLGEIKYHVIRSEFQFCGSADINLFHLMLYPAKLNKKSIKEYVVFLDQTVHSLLPDQIVVKYLYPLKLYQTR